MKLNGFVGKGSGKLGSSVFAISGGEQIVREYNPRVANPNTEGQVAQRAKFKLMSQLAAALAPGLAFKKMNLKSARNQFVTKNIGLCSYANAKATCSLANLELTPGSRNFDVPLVTIDAQSVVTVTNQNNLPSDIKKVVVVITEQSEQDTLQVMEVKAVDVTSNGTYSTTFNGEDGHNYLVYVYGWVPTSSSNSVTYDDYEIRMSEDSAFLESAMNNLLTNGVFTKTTSNTPTA